jgi:hypothetical protein
MPNAETSDLCHDFSFPDDFGEGIQALQRHNENAGTFVGPFSGAN